MVGDSWCLALDEWPLNTQFAQPGPGSWIRLTSYMPSGGAVLCVVSAAASM